MKTAKMKRLYVSTAETITPGHGVDDKGMRGIVLPSAVWRNIEPALPQMVKNKPSRNQTPFGIMKHGGVYHGDLL
jgi:hypothetical protein